MLTRSTSVPRRLCLKLRMSRDVNVDRDICNTHTNHDDDGPGVAACCSGRVVKHCCVADFV
jgi:hypothetical protein